MHATTQRTLAIATDAGTCPAFLHHPATGGPHPGVILYMDGPGMRPALQEIAARLAAYGYAVLLPDLFWRAGPYAPIDPKVVFTDPVLKERHRAQLMATATSANVMADTRAFLAALEAAPEASDGPIGVVGYCMGGRLALLAAGTFPHAIAAAASYHGGGLANDKPDSPHLLAPHMRASIYVAGAMEDDSFPDAMKQRLEAALTDAGVNHTIETYPARHGWVPRDTPAHDPAEAEHHWNSLTALLSQAIG